MFIVINKINNYFEKNSLCFKRLYKKNFEHSKPRIILNLYLKTRNSHNPCDFNLKIDRYPYSVDNYRNYNCS